MWCCFITFLLLATFWYQLPYIHSRQSWFSALKLNFFCTNKLNCVGGFFSLPLMWKFSLIYDVIINRHLVDLLLDRGNTEKDNNKLKSLIRICAPGNQQFQIILHYIFYIICYCIIRFMFRLKYSFLLSYLFT